MADLIDTGVSAPPGALSTSEHSIRTSPSGKAPPGLRMVRSWIDKRFFAIAATPAIVLVTLVTLIPLIVGIYLSFTNYQPISPSFKFAGLVNYRQLYHDGNTHAAIKNSLIFAGAGIVVELFFGLCIALLLARRMRGMSILRTIYVLPLMVAGVASAVTWRALLNTSNGWVNYFLGLVGLGQPNWLASTSTAMPSVILADAWGGVPIIAIVLLAGLLSLPKEPVDAARMDGASEFAILRFITLPGIRPVLAFAVLFRLVDLFRQFALFSIVTGGGPGLATNVLNFYVYQTTFVFGELGYGAALAIALVVLMAIPLLIIFKLASRGR